MLKTMLENSLSALQERAKEVFLNALLKPITDTKTKKRYKLRYWVWGVIWGVIVAVVIVGGCFLFFEVEGKPFQLPMKARDWTGFGESYDTNVSEVAEKGTETVGETTKKIDKVTMTQKKLQPAKTLWDWMGLLLAPATLAVLGFLFQSSQEQAKRDKEEADKKRDADQQREQALQAYLDQLSTLLVDKNLFRNLLDNLLDKEEGRTNSEAFPLSDKPVSKPVPEIEVKDPKIALDVVKAKTLALFRLFDNADPPDMPRKALVLTFLGDTGLLTKDVGLRLDLSRSDWKNADLSNADFSSAYLCGANFSSANLRNANLSNADLHSAKFRDADLKDADLKDADLSSADLSSADLSSANLSSANLSNADLHSAILRHANLTGTNLNAAKLIDANLRNAILNGAKLIDANLSSANLRNAKLDSANLRNAKLRFAKLRFAYLRFAKFGNADLSSAEFINADLKNADLRDANLSSAKFINADLKNADLRNAILLGVDFRNAEGLTQQQLEGEIPTLLCSVKLPEGINVDPYRDCEKLPEVLQRRYPQYFKTLKKAQDHVDSIRNAGKIIKKILGKP